MATASILTLGRMVREGWTALRNYFRIFRRLISDSVRPFFIINLHLSHIIHRPESPFGFACLREQARGSTRITTFTTRGQAQPSARNLPF